MDASTEDKTRIFDSLSERVSCAAVAARMVRELFYSSPTDVERERRLILESAAGYFFEDVHRALVNHAILELAKLADPPGKGEKRNLTLRSAIEELGHAAELADEVGSFESKVQKVKDYRNQRGAHNDWQVTTSGSKGPWGFCWQEVLDAVDQAEAMLRDLHERVRGSSLVLHSDGSLKTGVGKLLETLRDGLKWQRAELSLRTLGPEAILEAIGTGEFADRSCVSEYGRELARRRWERTA